MTFRKGNRNRTKDCKKKKKSHNPEPKPGDIVINRNNKEDEYSNNHPLLQHSKRKALIMTTKEEPVSGDKTTKVDDTEAYDFDATDSYVTNREVTNTGGKKIGKVTPRGLNRIKQWFINNS